MLSNLITVKQIFKKVKEVLRNATQLIVSDSLVWWNCSIGKNHFHFFII